ncbi:DNA/pantothenate metabolism flavoprotein [Halteromyces radiatus]|uniref:DNA/pantothenate metabolism flavoprotein n=1 Tax=Halteromyces radiatus TaxID=101107 RepID=UPI0022210496|nr:DNA/pantothenate metabolism flavoprotein [Halteromyces radiatus]KAI8086106.1 DNA/pantothenate metabolism flavoprotein [Halteromyces radiatus]
MPTTEQLLDNGQGVIDPDVFFKMNSPPANLKDFETKLEQFVDYHQEKKTRLVFITSGGTIVPLENQTVRFIDNFSNGHRGACSAEYFLEAGYAVVFMHRQFSLQPYHRHYTHNPSIGFLDYLVQKDDNIQVDQQYNDKMKTVLSNYQNAIKNNRLLLLDFVTLSDYLFKLKSGTRILARLQENAMYYLAAAVSDFFIPSEKMHEHKIQSGGGALTLTLDQVPKFLTPLVSVWASKGLIVSFKLETDVNLLVPKARQALTRYGHQVVVANMLSTRKQTVTVITKSSQQVLSLTPEDIAHHVEIESRIIPQLVHIHDGWISSGATKACQQ